MNDLSTTTIRTEKRSFFGGEITSHRHESLSMQQSPTTTNYVPFWGSLNALDDILRSHSTKRTELFCDLLLSYLAENIGAFKAVFYTYYANDEILQLQATYGILKHQVQSLTYTLGEGPIGQAASQQKTIHFENLSGKKGRIDFSTVKVNISDIYIIPLVFNLKTYGVIEFCLFKPLSEENIDFLKIATRNIAATLEGVLNIQITRDLLDQAQNQKEEILTQEEELKQTLEELVATHDMLERKNKEIDQAFKKFKDDNARLLSSIKYAQRMQKAILPRKEKILNIAQDCFLIYAPKDTVSGDFYWYGQVEEYHYVAVVDCTGHGVPGAFMSMIGNTLLNQVVIEKKVLEPADILNQLYYRVNEALSQDLSNNQDGMNLVLCRLLNIEGKYEMTFAGAKSNLYFTSGDRMYLIKGDRKSIGGFKTNKNFSFTQKTCNLQSGDLLYLMSDGLEDTCNQYRKPYGRNRIQTQLQQIKHLSLPEQKQTLWDDLQTFKGQTEQRDDITFLGLKLK